MKGLRNLFAAGVIVALSITMGGCGFLSKISVKKASDVCAKMGLEELSSNKMIDLVEKADSIDKADAYVIAEEAADLKDLCDYLFKLDYASRIDKALYSISGDTKHSVVLYALDFKTKEYAEKHMIDWIDNSSLEELTKLAEANSPQAYAGKQVDLRPDEVGESTEGNKDGISYYMVEFDLTGYGNNIIYAIWRTDKHTYIMTGTDMAGSTKAQRTMDDMCRKLGIITPSEVLQHKDHTRPLDTANNTGETAINDGSTPLSAAECNKAFSALALWIPEHPTFIQRYGYLSAFGSGSYKYVAEHNMYAYTITIYCSTGNPMDVTFASYNAPTDAEIIVSGDYISVK